MFLQSYSQTDSDQVLDDHGTSTLDVAYATTRRRNPWASEMDIETALGRAIWSDRGCSAGQALHWMHGNTLMAVVDTGVGVASYRTHLRCDDITKGCMVARPSSATFSPNGFVRKSVFDLLWHYGYYAVDAVDQLPVRVFYDKLSVSPRATASPSLLTLRHAAVLDALAHEPQSMAQLSALLDLPMAKLAKTLTPLYLARCISTRRSNLLTHAIARVRLVAVHARVLRELGSNLLTHATARVRLPGRANNSLSTDNLRR